jgi:hypothetical protein
MRTDDLIAQLSSGLEPVKNGAVTRLLLIAVGVGLAASALLMLTVLGPRHHFADALAGFGIWMKFAYTFALTAFGFGLVERAGRPGADMLRPALLLALPFAAIALLAALQMAAPGADMRQLVMGRSTSLCAVAIPLVAAPSLMAALWALRQLAPTRLALAGAGAGMFAGAMGAFVYAFHCPEDSAPFVAVWYTLWIAFTAAIGALLGRWALRW